MLELKPAFKIMMMGSLEEDISLATTAPENMDEVVNDLDLTEEEIALENKEEYLAKVCVNFATKYCRFLLCVLFYFFSSGKFPFLNRLQNELKLTKLK